MPWASFLAPAHAQPGLCPSLRRGSPGHGPQVQRPRLRPRAAGVRCDRPPLPPGAAPPWLAGRCSYFPSSVSVSPLNGERPRTRRSSVLLCPQTYNSSPDLPLNFRPLCLLGGRRGVSHRTGLKRLDLSRAKTLTPRASPSQGVAGPTCPKAFAPSLPPFSVSPLV